MGQGKDEGESVLLEIPTPVVARVRIHSPHLSAKPEFLRARSAQRPGSRLRFPHGTKTSPRGWFPVRRNETPSCWKNPGRKNIIHISDSGTESGWGWPVEGVGSNSGEQDFSRLGDPHRSVKTFHPFNQPVSPRGRTHDLPECPIARVSVFTPSPLPALFTSLYRSLSCCKWAEYIWKSPTLQPPRFGPP